MAPAKYNPPSARTMGAEKFVNTIWKPHVRNVRHYDYQDLLWFIQQDMPDKSIALAFGFRSAKPIVDIKLVMAAAV